MSQTTLRSASDAAREALPGRWLMAAMVGLLLLVALPLLASCGDSQPAATGSPPAAPSQLAPALAASPVATPAASSSSSPPTPSGVTATVAPQPGLDPIVQALLSRDWATIQPLLQEHPEACITTPRIGLEGPVCPAGVSPGTPVSVFPASGCHWFMSAAELEGQFGARGDAPRMYAIYRASAQHPRVSRLPPGDIGIILDRGNSGGQIFTVSGAKIVSADFGCGIPAREVAAQVPSNAFLVAPPAP